MKDTVITGDASGGVSEVVDAAVKGSTVVNKPEMKIGVESSKTKTTNWTALYGLYIILFVDLLCVGMIVPLITELMKGLDASATMIGMLSTIYGGVQLFSAPILGFLSDHRISRREVHIVCTLGSAFGYLVLAYTPNIWLALVSRVIVGVFRQTMTISKAVMSDLSVPDDRARALGNLYTVVSCGFAVGPVVGGTLADMFSPRMPILLGTALFCCNAVLIWLLIPKKLQTCGGSESDSSVNATQVSDSGRITKEIDDEKGPEGTVTSKKYSHTDKDQESAKKPGASDKHSNEKNTIASKFSTLQPAVQKLMIIRLLISLSNALSRQAIRLLMEFGQTKLSYSEKGQVFSFYSVASILAQTLLVPLLLRNMSLKQVVVWSSVLMSVAEVLMAESTSVNMFFFTMAMVAVWSSALKVAMHSILTITVGEGHFGEVLGVADSVKSLTTAVVPIFAGVITEAAGASAPGYLAGLCTIAAAIMATFMIEDPGQKTKID